MAIKYKHTNIIAKDWKALVAFYQTVFGCVFMPPERHLSGTWLDQGTGVKDACFSGGHLLLPGHGPDGPTLEIYQYTQNEPRPKTAANREGLMHLAFEVDDVPQTTKAVLDHGGSMVGEIVSSTVLGVGLLTFVYMVDPEGNILELQAWS